MTRHPFPYAQLAAASILAVAALAAAIAGWPAAVDGAAAPPGATVMLDVQREYVSAELRLPMDRLEAALAQPLPRSPLPLDGQTYVQIARYLERHVGVTGSDGRAWAIEPGPMRADLSRRPVDLVVQLDLIPPEGADLRRFTLRDDLAAGAPAERATPVAVRSDWQGGVLPSRPRTIGALRDPDAPLRVDLGAGSDWNGFAGALRLGVGRAADGVDPLLFLCMLLLPAPLLAAGARWARTARPGAAVLGMVRVTAAFSGAHALAVLAGALGWVSLGPQPLAILLAGLALAAALHALRPLFPGRETCVAAGFGLLAGLGRADAVDGVRLDPWRMLQAVSGYNLGIELMQLALVACVLPWLLLAARTPRYRLLRIAGGVGGTAAACGCILERAFGWPGPGREWIDGAAQHPLWLAAAGAAVAACVLARTRTGSASAPAGDVDTAAVSARP